MPSAVLRACPGRSGRQGHLLRGSRPSERFSRTRRRPRPPAEVSPRRDRPHVRTVGVVRSGTRPYLFLQTNEGRRFVYDAGIVPSQYVRRIVTAELGMPERWHWREYLGLEELKRTFAALSGWRTLACASALDDRYGMEPSRPEDYDAVASGGDPPALGPEGRPLGRRPGRRALPLERGRRLPPVPGGGRRGRGRTRGVLPRPAPGRSGLRHGPGVGRTSSTASTGPGHRHQPADAGRRGRPARCPASSFVEGSCFELAGQRRPRPAAVLSRGILAFALRPSLGPCPCSAGPRGPVARATRQFARSSISSMPRRAARLPRESGQQDAITRRSDDRDRWPTRPASAACSILGEPQRRVLLLLAER